MPVRNKAAIINEVAEATGQSKAATERFLIALQNTIIGAVAGGEEVKLTGFAAFAPSVRLARTIRHPQTGDMLDVPEAKTVRIRPLKNFRDAVTGLTDEA